MGYLYIDGRGMKLNGGSCYNFFEVEIIVVWLVVYKDDIECYYGELLYKVVGVVMLFLVQVNVIKMLLCKLEINGKDEQGLLIVGIVYFLQGVERVIVFFFFVYLKYEDGRFFDSNSIIFNVVVLCVKDSFLVFGDMDFIEMQFVFLL